jgi:putative ABC transport system ATP-binding protein
MNGHQIECISLSKYYKRNNHVLYAVDDINLGILKNELVLLTGRSGAGKSTLLNLMCGLIKPTSGRVIIDDKCVSELPNNDLSDLLQNRIGIIFQSFNLLPTYTVFENIEIALAPNRSMENEVHDNIIKLLKMFNLTDKTNSLPSELSVGQQQKVAIIRTLIKQPAVIFADEPTGSVDKETAVEIIEYLINLKKETLLTLIVASHGNFPEKLADKVYVMENGRIK